MPDGHFYLIHLISQYDWVVEWSGSEINAYLYATLSRVLQGNMKYTDTEQWKQFLGKVNHQASFVFDINL